MILLLMAFAICVVVGSGLVAFSRHDVPRPTKAEKVGAALLIGGAIGLGCTLAVAIYQTS